MGQEPDGESVDVRINILQEDQVLPAGVRSPREPATVRISEVARRWPVTVFFVLAFAFTWTLLPLASQSIAVSLVALCGPAFAALVTAALCGSAALRDLRERIIRWRVPVRWYVLALLAPLPISALASGLEVLAGAPGPVYLQPISVLQAVVFVLVIGEEIGWRGFALPRLLSRTGPWTASAVLGVAWALWHLPLFYLSAMPQFGSPFLPYVVYTIALSVLLTLFAQRTEGSVIIATLFHGAVNTLLFTNAAATPTIRGWGNAVSYGLVALVLGIVVWNRRSPRAGAP